MVSRIYSLQALRGIAALAVVAVHTTHDAAVYAARPVLETIGERGAAGVDVFFVISGFVMLMTTHERTAPGDFIWRRVLRVVPLYWLATLLQLGLTLLSHGMYRPGAAEVASSFAFLPYVDDAGEILPVLHVGWTLNLEMFFYVLFALALIWARLRVEILVVILVSLVAVGLLFSPAQPVARAWTNPIIVEFCLGCIAARIWSAGFQVSAWVATGVVVISCVVVGMAPSAIQSSAWRPLVWGGPAFAIVMALTCCRVAERLAAWKGAQTLGDASYSIYLFHTAVLIVLGRVWTVVGMPPWWMLLAVPMACAIIVGSAAFAFLEHPLTIALRSFAGRPKAVTTPL